MSFIKNLKYTFSSQIVIFILSFLFSLVIARVLGPEGQGYFTLCLLIPTLVARFGHLGLDNANAFFIKIVDEKKRHLLFSHSIIFCILTCGYSALFFLLYFSIFHSIPFGFSVPILIIILCLVFTNMFKTVFLSVLVGLDRLKVHSLISIVESGLPFGIAIILFLFDALTPVSLLIGLLLTGVLVVIILTINLRIKKNIKFSGSLLKDSLRCGFKSWWNNLANQLNYRVDILFISFFLGYYEVGIYSVAVLIIEKVWFFNTAINNALFPKTHQMSLEEGALFTSRIVRVNLIISIVGACFLGFISQWLIPFLFSEDYLNSVQPLLWLIPGVVFLSIPKIIVAHLASKDKLEYAAISSSIACVINIIINYLLIPRLGIVGAAISSSISYLVYSLLYIYFYLRITSLTLSTLLIPKKSDFFAIVRKFKNKGD
ncbi:oligosaccharide flippase family protein [bacterium]|nr:oligosaccharide flippase family protein [bacterium]